MVVEDEAMKMEDYWWVFHKHSRADQRYSVQIVCCLVLGFIVINYFRITGFLGSNCHYLVSLLEEGFRAEKALF